ncbi:MAG: dimethyl sulfoxide reductase anchor subunit [Clostridia bacterium]|nr:dimethyl sulfoxide reductase anchor subunit [Clostridia bacterium]
MGEWPLILFTVLSQLVVGAVGTLWLLETLGKPLKGQAVKPLVGSLVIILGGGLLISLFHLGHPLLAFRAITNLGSSWLSREVLLFSITLVLLVLYYMKISDAEPNGRKAMGGLASLVALLALIASALVYTLPARSAWGNLYPTFFFIMTAAILGPLYVGLFLSRQEELPFNTAPLAGTAALISGIGFILYLSLLLKGTPESYQTALNLMGSASFWARAVLNWLLPAGILLAASLKKTKVNQSTLAALFLMVLIGEVLGRELFYSATVALKVAGL